MVQNLIKKYQLLKPVRKTLSNCEPTGHNFESGTDNTSLFHTQSYDGNITAMETAINNNNNLINIRMVSDAAAMFDITATMMKIIKVGQLLISLPHFIVLSILCVVELILILELNFLK